NLLATAGDITMTWTSPMYPKLHSNDSSINPLSEPITDNQAAWIGSLINVGAMVGPLPFGFISEQFGRKIGLLCIAIPHFIAYISMAFAKNVYIFYFGRLLGGLAVGGGYTLLPMYIAEVAEESQRGIYSVTLGIFWAFGNFLSYLIGPYLSVVYFNCVLSYFPFAFFLSFSYLGTETPFYLVKKDRMEEAEKVLMRLRSSDRNDVHIELNQIKATINKEKNGQLSDVIRNSGMRKALIISVTLIALQQFSGINAIYFYLQTIFKASGTKLSSDISSLIVGACIFVFSLLVPYTVDCFGRRTLMIFSSVGMALCLFSMGSFFYVKERTAWSTEPIFWLPLTTLILLIFVFQMGFSIMPWTISSELFPSNLKQFAASATSLTCWVTSFIVTQFFNNMTNSIGTGETFWVFATFSAICTVFTIFYIPETRGKTFSEIQSILRRTSVFQADRI
ncbi:Facilitated trehalose transporter Tret1, partial [Gonioctena quinquepunctata]